MDLKFRILVFVLQLHIAVSYKSYKFNKLCPTSKFKVLIDQILDDKPNIELENSNDLSVALISQKWDDQTYKSVQHCDFMVIAKPPASGGTSGIFASIRKMNLRKDANNACIDYVIFEVGSGESQKSQKMCGTVTDDEVFNASNYFEAPADCTSNSLECQPKKCISKDLENDTILNCPPPNCLDEPSLADHCKIKPIYQAPSSHVLAISALTSLFMVMFCIVTCWYCFKFRNCWGDNQANNPNTSGRSGTSRPDMEFQTIRIPATPDIGASAPSPMDDHDKPPSYDSLFKDRKVL